MKLRIAAALFALGAATAALAGPPYLTDPVPTDTGHREIYVFTGGEAQRSNVDDESGLDLRSAPASARSSSCPTIIPC